ncbi:MAG: cytochrome c oxidase assembly protein [Candidatus Binatia bacterium]
MTSAAEAALASWRVPFWPAVIALVAAVLYARGWRVLHRQSPERFAGRQLCAFLAGLASVLIAVGSPLDAFAPLLLLVHMLQHALLTMVAPPLLWIGAPALPLLRGLPSGLAKQGLGPFLAWPGLRRAARTVVHPIAAWLALAVAVAFWHLPPAYELALRSPAWHEVEHFCFLFAGLLFWFPVVQPYPSRAHWPRWAMIPYLLCADLTNTALAALFAFAERPLYATYAAAPRIAGFDARADQAAAGALMWVLGSAAYLAAAGMIIAAWLGGRTAIARAAARPARAVVHAPAAHLDLLRLPVLGPALRTGGVRRALQVAMLLLAAALVADGLLGPQVSPLNLAGVLPWTYWRGFVVLALLILGNAFCMLCPFMLPRALAKHVLPAARAWPRWLRNKWPAALLLVGYLWAYEIFDLWDRPALTALIALGYFAAAFAVDGIFRGAAFCKHLCPIGQFHFVHATVSPFEIQARDADVCRRCTTHDCVRGNERQRGCELELFVPEKRGNLDCTLCFDCVRACPHDNVGLIGVAPAADLARDPPRSSLRRLSERPDIAALALVCAFGAFANAAGMIEPVLGAEQALAQRIGSGAARAVGATALLFALVAVPAGAAAAAAWASRRLAGVALPFSAVATRGALALIPLGLGMWSAHFAFHLLSGIGTLPPVVQRVAADLGTALLGAPAWASACPTRAPDWVTGLELLLLDAGLVLSAIVGWRSALDLADGQARRAIRLQLPWALLALLLWTAGAWMVFQPMQMRGMAH